MTEVGACIPVAQGIIWIAGDTMLEVKQGAKIFVLMNYRAMDVAKSITQQEKWHYYNHGEFRFCRLLEVMQEALNCHLKKKSINLAAYYFEELRSVDGVFMA